MDAAPRREELAQALSQAELPLPQEERGLPRLAQELLRKRNRLAPSRKFLRPFEALASQLDRTFPGWPETAAALIVEEDKECRGTAAQAAASLLALRPLTFTGPLCQALVQPRNAQERELAALALFRADTAEVRAAFRQAFAALTGEPLLPGSSESRALWLVFARLALEKTLSYEDFFRLALESQLFQPEGYPCGRMKLTAFHPCLERSGLSRQPELRRFYSMLAAEIVPVGDATPLRWTWLRWMRGFSGADYFFEALDRLQRSPNDLKGLFVLRWSRDLGENAPDFGGRLARYPPILLMIASILKPDLEVIIGEFLGSPFHSQAMQWLRLPCAKAAESAVSLRESLLSWMELHGSLLGEAAGLLCCVQIPEEEPVRAPTGPEEVERVRRFQRFLCLHLLPEFPDVLDNLLLLQGMRGLDIERLEESARAGRLAAIRALGLTEKVSEEGARLLVDLAASGPLPVRRAAKWALDKTVSQHHLGSLQALRKKLDLAAAWQDGGLVGAPARVWWDIAGHRVKLSVAAGKVELSAWGPGRKKSIPAAVRAHALFAEAQESRKALARAYAVFRQRLEETMLTGWAFDREHFRLLFANPAFRSLSERLAVSLGGEEILLEGREAGEFESSLRRAEQVRVVHPIEMWSQGTLEQWQEKIVAGHILQPFKQCFREIYPLEAAERGQTSCRRFANQPIIVRTAYALLRRRGYSPCNGVAYRDWPAQGLRARLVWSEESEGLWEHLVGRKQILPLNTGEIYFEALRGEAVLPEPLPLEEVDAVVFSETLRDADLVVSAAAAGEEGFSSRQTVEIRAALVRNYARLLSLPGVKVEPGSSHALVQGERACYRVHLGSGRVLMEPSGRHLVAPLTTAEPPAVAPEEKSDSRTLAILETVAALSHDSAISDAAFLAALSAV